MESDEDSLNVVTLFGDRRKLRKDEGTRLKTNLQGNMVIYVSGENFEIEKNKRHHVHISSNIWQGHGVTRRNIAQNMRKINVIYNNFMSFLFGKEN